VVLNGDVISMDQVDRRGDCDVKQESASMEDQPHEDLDVQDGLDD
jgi:hypothetical protein